MSTSWDVYCRTCAASLGLDVDGSTGEKLAHDLTRLAPMLSKLVEVKDSIDNEDWPLEFVGIQALGRTIDLKWLEAHVGHELIPQNEYGEFPDQCNARAVCACCGSRYRCVLTPKHEGDHAGVKPK